ncbi:MAG: hypothetical protein AAGI23_19730 [Bacteroidota bacterium]
MKKLFSLLTLVLGVCAFVNAQTANDLLDPTTIGDGGNELEFSVEGSSNGADLVLTTLTGTGRTRLRIAPGGSDNRAFLQVQNASDAANTGNARLGVRGTYAILSAANSGTPASPLSNVGIELDPNGDLTGESFVVSTGGFLGGSAGGVETILAKVDVNGLETIEAKVQASVAAPDYVFADDYNLRSLEEVEAYINEYSHLPEIPSAAEFEADGIKLGKMSFDLLKKVEELTLYMIEMKKENEELKARIQELESK